MFTYSADDRLTGFDYGIKTGVNIRPRASTMDLVIYDRPHSSPAMERALQRIGAHCWRPTTANTKEAA